MIHKNLTLLENCSGKVSYEGKPVKAIGYYSTQTNKRLNTVSIHTINFTGRIYIYGTLKLNPTDEDWVVIPIGKDGEEYLEFDHYPVLNACRDNVYVNIKGGWTYLKAKMDREYLHTIKTPVPINYRISHGTHVQNIWSDFSVPMNDRIEKVIPPPTPDLRYFGNVEYIKLTY